MEMTKGIKDTPAHRCVKLYTHLFTSFCTARQCVRDGLKRIMHLQIEMTDVFTVANWTSRAHKVDNIYWMAEAKHCRH